MTGTFTLVSSGAITGTDCGVWITSDGVAVTPSVVMNFLTRNRVVVKTMLYQHSAVMQYRAQAEADAYTHVTEGVLLVRGTARHR